MIHALTLLLLFPIMSIADNKCSVNNNFGGANMENKKIREEARNCGVKLWQIAERLGINDGNFSRKLRRELPAAEQERIIAVIHNIAEGA